jgi:chemotaxis protein methyltransferase CheR
MRNVKPETLRRYFTDTGGGYRVVDTIRKRVEFRELNLLSGRFERDFDLIVCRNVMIYFSDETKQRLFERFHDALRPSGVLFVGGTEALLGAETFGFSRISGNFYRRVDVAKQERLSA